MDSSKAFVDMSTVDEYTVKEINQGIKAKGGRYLEAPVSGSKVPAEQGTVSFYVGVLAYTLNPRQNTKSVLKLSFQLLIMCAGDEDLFKECRTCFDAMGKESYYLGDVGAGARMKLVVNAIMGAQMAALAEGLQLGQYSILTIVFSFQCISYSAYDLPQVLL